MSDADLDDGLEDETDSVPGGERQEMTLELPAVHAAARLARHLIRPFAKSVGITGSELDHLVLVASELIGNAVDHGGGQAALDPGHHAMRMILSLEASREGWILAVSDQGGGEPEALRELIEPKGLPDLEDERGRGFFLIQEMVDRITVERSADGTGLRLVAERRHGQIEAS